MYTINAPIHTHGQDNTVAVWDMVSPMDIFLRKVLEGHMGSVNAVDFDEKYIVSGSDDKTIKVCEKGERERRGRGRKGRSRGGWVTIGRRGMKGRGHRYVQQ